MKCFNQGQREVPFSYFDVALLAGLSAIEKYVVFGRSEGTSEVEEVLKEAMKECVSQERQRRRTVYMDMCVHRNYASILLKLYRMHNIVETVGLFRKLCTLLVVSWLFLPRCVEGVSWDLISVVENVGGMGVSHLICISFSHTVFLPSILCTLEYSSLFVYAVVPHLLAILTLFHLTFALFISAIIICCP